jgi:hypothetical protein
MTRALLSLSCLLALAACSHATPEPDFRPSRDIPPGAIVHVTLRDRHEPRRVSTYVVDARAGKLLMRLDGARALELQQTSPPPRPPSFAPSTPMRGEQQGETGTQTSSSSFATSFTLEVDCPPPAPGEKQPEGCLDANAIDPKLETTGNPDPQDDPGLRWKRTEQFAIKLAQGIFQAAKLSGIQGFQRR